MSTKTTFKRIALVAVAALGFGVRNPRNNRAEIAWSFGFQSYSEYLHPSIG
jgi:hypothetical protein